MNARARVALGAAVLVAAAWWWSASGRRSEPAPGGAEASCEDAAACSIDAAASQDASRIPSRQLDGEGDDDRRSQSRTGQSTDEPAPDEPARAEPAPAGTNHAAPVAVPVSPEEARRLREEADRLLVEGRFVEGVEALRRATDADPSARNHGDLGAQLEKGTAFRDAVVHLKRAAELDPGNADRWIALANAYYRMVDLGKAWAAEKRAIEAEPGLVLGRDAGGMRIRVGDTRIGTK